MAEARALLTDVVRRVSPIAPLRWMGQGWSDLSQAPFAFLIYGLLAFLVGLSFSDALAERTENPWALPLTCLMVFAAPMFLLGLYEAGRLIDSGQRPTLGLMLFVQGAARIDVLLLGCASVFLYLVAAGIAPLFQHFMPFEVVCAVALAFVAACIAFVATPMMLDARRDIASVARASFVVASKNLVPLSVWLGVVVALSVVTLASDYIALVIIFPWLGLAGWRAYRELSGAAL
ncbi:MAG: hypothetical protein ABWZ40_05365 [Caulobacterales bacterium]